MTRTIARLTINPEVKANPGPQLLRWVRAVSHTRQRKIILGPSHTILRVHKETR